MPSCGEMQKADASHSVIVSGIVVLIFLLVLSIEYKSHNQVSGKYERIVSLVSLPFSPSLSSKDSSVLISIVGPLALLQS